jgi:ribosome-binding factor A
MTRRTEKVSSLLHQEISRLIHELELPALTTVSKVQVTPDLKWGKTFITVMGDEAQQKQVLAELKNNIYDIQKSVNAEMGMKIVPRISFVLDHGQEYASKINELLRKANEE